MGENLETDCLPALLGHVALLVFRRLRRLADWRYTAQHPKHNVTQRTPRTDAIHGTPHH
jgi:hypothetical protein